MDSTQILFMIVTAIVSTIGSFLVVRLGDKSKVTEAEMARLIKDMEHLKATAVNEVRVREIIKDAIEPTSSDVKEIKLTMRELNKTLQDIQLKLMTELAYKHGKDEGK